MQPRCARLLGFVVNHCGCLKTNISSNPKTDWFVNEHGLYKNAMIFSWCTGVHYVYRWVIRSRLKPASASLYTLQEEPMVSVSILHSKDKGDWLYNLYNWSNASKFWATKITIYVGCICGIHHMPCALLFDPSACFRTVWARLQNLSWTVGQWPPGPIGASLYHWCQKTWPTTPKVTWCMYIYIYSYI